MEFNVALKSINNNINMMNTLENPMKIYPQVTVYNLFQTDIWKNKKSRVFFGSFSSFEKAKQAANDLELYNFESEIVILEVVVDEVWND